MSYRGGGGGSGGGGRERMRREEKGRGIGSGGGGNPPSRHLFVGNLPHGISEREFTDRFLRFGELESVAFQLNRSYAFVNFKHDEDAFAAIDSLQGFPLAGNPLRIEFAKADKSSTASRTEDQFRREEHRSATRGSSFIQKDSRMHYESPESYSKSMMADRDAAEPSEVLWIGFPAMLRVDEAILRKAFSPFGEIEKITIFPGRSYAFVQFRSLAAACKAKETLQGKLFGNPRVHICFAKSEPSSSNTGRAALSPRSVDRLGSSEVYLQGKNYAADMDRGDHEDYMFNRKGTSRKDGNFAYETLRSTHRVPQDMYECHDSPRERDFAFHDGHQRLPSRRSSVNEEPWGLPEDDYIYHESKRLKIGSVLPEKELPDYLLSGIERERRAVFRLTSDLSPPDAFERNFDDGKLRYRRMSEQPHEDFRTGFRPLPSTVSPERKRYTSEPDRPSLKDWKWEGTIAKGGNPICRARCFPVGKVMDMMLPEFLDCTARTGLDMLVKHYYQASNAWVVFFVPGSDADMVFYNEFMHYLEEKQRAAVSKLDDRTTLFLVPPSDFSEKVLKVPGKLSISGVVLRIEYPSSGSGPGEIKDRNLLTSPGETSYAMTDFLPSGVQDAPLDPPYMENRHERPTHQSFGSDWPPRDLQASVSITRRSHQQASSSGNNRSFQGHHLMMHGQPPDSDLSQYPKITNSAQMPLPAQLSGLQPEQLAQLASSLLGQHNQGGNPPNQHERNTVDISHDTPELSTPSQFIHLQQRPSGQPPVQREVQTVYQGNRNEQVSSNTREGEGEEEETEANPQKRLQATLQLAAALLQQIQQAKGT
ncbi:PREDICTED: flowering time control protein FPA [Tarenaya hassleriana]|uniref:flowering time control protein FPA n=1 Tax=Tarenaya hassleriana TaxID=28532 RepID=UPI00053C83B0|nr:PREDICTED: flowering time control protein FPA [Tarenaya hassleriana]